MNKRSMVNMGVMRGQDQAIKKSDICKVVLTSPN